MSLYNGRGIAQQVPAPAPQSTGARYRLSFLYDNRSDGPGTFSLRRRGTEDSLEIALPPRGNAAADSEIRELTLTLVTESVDFDVEEEDLFEFVIRSPSVATSTRDVIVALIDFHLELDPLVLARIVNDGQAFTPLDQPMLYLCHGATGAQHHQLSFQLAADSPWAGTEALLWNQGNPLEAVIVSPEWGENQRIEDAWQVNCPRPVDNDTHLFDLFIYSKYHADTYPITVSLGHHRLVVESIQDPAYQPVIEYAQTVRLGVRVKSYYLDLPMRGHEVSWMIGEDVLAVSETDEGGEAWFDFAPATEGTLAVKASVESPFYAQGSALHTFTVKAHATDPLKAVRIKFPNMNAALWGEQTGFPDRGATYPVEVLFDADSPLRNLDVWLEWEGKAPEELGVTVQPALLTPVPVTGDALTWRLVCDDRNGIDEFGLCLGCAVLQRPTVSNAMSLARHSLTIGGVREANRVPVVDEHDYVWCMLQVTSLGGQPIAGVPVEWDTSQGLQRTWTGTNGWASVIDRPTTHGNYTLAARVNPREGGQELGHPFAIQTLATSAWNTASFTLDGVAVDRVGAGAVCLMGQDSVFHLAVASGSPLIGKEVFLRWQDPASARSIVIANMETPVAITPAGLDWPVQVLVTDAGGVFDLQVVSTGLEALDLAFRALPQDLSTELSLVFDQAPKNWGAGAELYPCIGAAHDLTLLPEGDPGGLHGLLFETTVAPDLPAGWEMTPPLTEPAPMTAGGVRYRCDFSGASQSAQRSWAARVLGVEAFTQPPTFALKLAHNKVVVGTAFEVATDPVLSKGESARLALRYVSAFTKQPANEVNVVWDDGQTSQSGADGIAQRAYQPAAAGNQQVQALVNNPYDGTEVEQGFDVFAHQEDPWLDLNVQSYLGDPRPWGEQTFFPRRAERLELTVSVLEDSPLLDQNLALGYSGAHGLDTGLQFGPVGLGKPQTLTAAGLSVSLLAEGQTDAAFYLQLSASRLLARSPLNAFSLGSHVPVDVASATNQERQVVDWGEVLLFEITLVNAVTGQPARNVPVSWTSTDEAMEPVTTTTDFYGVARFSFIATVSGPGTVRARAVGGIEVVELEYLVHEACVIESLSSPDLEGVPGDEISAEATVVSAATGEPVAGVRVHWFFKGLVLAPSVTDAQGKAPIAFELPSRIGHYTLSASVRGEFGWDSDWLEAKVLGTEDSWVQEFTLWLNGAPVDMDYLPVRRLVLVHGRSHVLELRVNKDSALMDETEVALFGTPPISLGLVFDPRLYVYRPVTATPLRWTIETQDQAYGVFEVELRSPVLPPRLLPCEVSVQR
ncbi:Ig-like domain-containing protein [Pseudomonas halotolerans]|uniref:Ig-like domain-containing protein n=1 Tax=Pseudomonas halotolerans TaxID=3143552 RepID=UPI0031D0D13F